VKHLYPSPYIAWIPAHAGLVRRAAPLSQTQIRIWAEVAKFSSFTEDDIHGEHDFGVFRTEGVQEKIFWKIDYYADITSAADRKAWFSPRRMKHCRSPTCC